MFFAPRFHALRQLSLVCLMAASGTAALRAQTASNPLAVSFGSQAVELPQAQADVTFTVTGGGTLGTPLVLTSGVPNLDYTLGMGSTCVGDVGPGTCTVSVIFTPTAPGNRFGAVELTDASNAVIATALIYGTGVGPQVTFTPGTLSTVAGSGTPCADPTTPCGDGGSATDPGANLFSPFGVSVDAAGNLYIADSLDSRVRKVTLATGIITTVAGTGTPCSGPTATCGDGGLATAAQLAAPAGVAWDGAGNLYIADYDENRIRKLTAATGILSTVVGSGALCAYPTYPCGDGGLATDPAAAMNYPSGIAVDGAGNLYIVDNGDNRIRMVSAATGILSTIAGSGTPCSSPTAPCGDGEAATSANAAFNDPFKLAIDTAGNLYIADTGDHRIRMVTAATGILSTLAGSGTPCSSPTATCGDGGLATDPAADLINPAGITVDAAGNVYISDTDDNRIRIIWAATGVITTMAGTGNPCSATTAPCGDGGSAMSPDAAFTHPGMLALDGAGDLYFADYWDNRIRKVSATAAPLTYTSTAVGQTSSPQFITVNNIGNTALTFAPPFSGSNPGITPGFSVGNSSTCPQLSQISNPGALASQASCTYFISFQPTNAGVVNGVLTTTDNAPSGTQSVSLTGTGSQGTKTITFPQPPSQPAGSSYTLTATTSTGDPVTYTVTSGPATVAGSVVTYTGAGSVTIAADSADSPNATAAATVSDTVTVIPAAASQFIITTSPTSTYVGGQLTVTVTAMDAYGDIASGYAGTVALTSTDPGPATLPANFALVSGSATATVSFNTLTNTGWTITATDTVNTSITGTSAAILTNPVPVFTINSSAGDTSGSCTDQALAGSAAGTTTDSACTVYAAFAAVSALNNTSSAVPTINFVPALYASTITMSMPVTVTGNFALIGPGAGPNTITLSGNGYTNNFLTQTTNSVATISGLSFIWFSGNDGGVFSFAGGSTSLANDVFTSNVASGSHGGAVLYQSAGTVNVTASTFNDNLSLNSGGAIWLQGGATTITNSTFTGNAASNGSGGVILQNSGTLNLSNNTYTSNLARTSGGAIYSSAPVTEADSTYTLNAADHSGGAIDAQSTLTIANSTFTQNSGVTSGGALYVLGALTMTSGATSFTGNYVYGSSFIAYGGAVYATGGSTISSVSFTNNYVQTSSNYAFGGAAYLSNTTTVANSLFSGNYVSAPTAAYGGAVYGHGDFTGLTMTGNYTTGAASTQYGGALYINNSTNLYNDTITGNSAKTGGGVYSGIWTATAYNTAISGNTATQSYKDAQGVSVNGANYINTDASTVCTTNCTPLLSPLGNHGGANLTMLPLPGSPLLAAGAISSVNGATIDARGYPRTISYNSTAHTDLGAVTANYTLSFVTQPTNTTVNVALLPPPTVQVYESGVPFGGTGGSLTVAASSGTLYTDANDSAAYTSIATSANGLQAIAPFFATPQSGDSLIVSITDGNANTIASTTSMAFNIDNILNASIAFTTAPPPLLTTGANAGMVLVALTSAGGTTNTSVASTTVTLTVNATNYTANTVNGVASFDFATLNSGAPVVLPTGTYSYTASAASYTNDTVSAIGTVGLNSVWTVNANAMLVQSTTAGTLVNTVANTNSSAADYGGLAFDNTGDVYSVNSTSNALFFSTNTGGSTASYTGGGLNAPAALAIDGAGMVWIANSGNNSLAVFNSARTALSPSTGFGNADSLSSPSSVAIDNAGTVWIANKSSNSVTHLFGGAAPVVTPLATATANGALGTQP